MTTLSNGKVTVQVPEDRAEHFAQVLGMSIIDDVKVQESIETPRPKRGRPKKVS